MLSSAEKTCRFGTSSGLARKVAAGSDCWSRDGDCAVFQDNCAYISGTIVVRAKKPTCSISLDNTELSLSRAGILAGLDPQWKARHFFWMHIHIESADSDAMLEHGIRINSAGGFSMNLKIFVSGSSNRMWKTRCSRAIPCKRKVLLRRIYMTRRKSMRGSDKQQEWMFS